VIWLWFGGYCVCAGPRDRCHLFCALLCCYFLWMFVYCGCIVVGAFLWLDFCGWISVVDTCGVSMAVVWVVICFGVWFVALGGFVFRLCLVLVGY